MPMKPGITLICITRDQAGKLLRMLQSVRPYVEDIVVFDTGSRDLSPGVARMNGARVFEIEWPDSFSQALNLACEEVRTEWTLRLDTDEWLADGAGPQLKQVIGVKDVLAHHLIRCDYSDEEHWSESWHLRLWRTEKRLRFVGHIHEHFDPAVLADVASGRKVAQTPIRFWHDGFVGDVPRAKHERNVHLLRKELAERPGQLYYEIELATTLLELGDREGEERVNELANTLLAQPDRLRETPLTANVLGTALMLVRRRDLEGERAARLRALALEHFAASPPMLWALAKAELRRGDHQAVLDVLLRMEKLAESGQYQREWLFDGVILREGLWEFLAQVAEHLGRDDVASRNRRRLVGV